MQVINMQLLDRCLAVGYVCVGLILFFLLVGHFGWVDCAAQLGSSFRLGKAQLPQRRMARGRLAKAKLFNRLIGSVFQAVLQLLSIAKQCEQRRDHTLLVRVLLCIANVHLIRDYVALHTIVCLTLFPLSSQTAQNAISALPYILQSLSLCSILSLDELHCEVAAIFCFLF